MTWQEQLLTVYCRMELLALYAHDSKNADLYCEKRERLDKAVRRAKMESRGWVTINGKHVFIGEDSGGGSSGGGQAGASEQSGKESDSKVESDLYKQDSASLKRAIRRYQKRIDEHKDKISHPEKYVRDWDTYDNRRQNGLLKHWNKEIQNFSVSIQRREDELKKRGDYDE